MSIKSRSAKNKGLRLQKWVCKKISKMLEIPWGNDELIRSREAGQSGTDVVLLGETAELFPFSVECANKETWDVHTKIKQAKTNTKEGTDWLCVFKRNNEDPIVVMDAEVFFKIYKENIDWRFPD